MHVPTDGDRIKWLSEMTLVNPEIVEKSTKTEIIEEGCLSFPGMNGDVSFFGNHVGRCG